MINPELEKYVDTALKSGMEAANIRHILISAGWSPKDVDDAITAQTGPQQPTPGPGTAVVTPPTEATPAMSPTMPAATAEASPEAQPKPKIMLSKKTLLIAGGVLALVLVAGGVGFAFYSGALSLGGKLSDAELLAKLPDNLQAIRSATYEGTLDFVSEPREANVKPFLVSDYYTPPPTTQIPPIQNAAPLAPGSTTEATQPAPQESPAVSFLQSLDEWYPQLPSDISVHVNAGGSTLNADSSTTDASFHGGADVKLADFNISADVDFLKKDSNLYFRVNKFPSLFFDISALKGKWVVVTPQDLGGSAGIFGLFGAADVRSFVDESQKANSKNLEQARLIYQIAGQEGLIVNKAPATSERLDGQSVRHFRLTVAKDKISGFYARATTELKDKYGDEAILSFNQETADYLASPAFGKLFDYLEANTTFDLWLDSKTGQIAKYSYALRLVPPPKVEKLKDIQYSLKMTLALKDVNRPSQVTAPSGTMSFEDAEILLSGKSREEFFAEKQVSNIRSIRYALGTYHDYAKKYPDTLDALMISYTDLYKMDKSGTDFFESPSKLLDGIPVDTYTKKPYAYRKNGADYVIEYVVDIPDGSTDYALQDVTKGVNHANSKTISVEKSPNGDGLPAINIRL